MGLTSLLVADVLAQAPSAPNAPGGQGPEFGGASPVALVVVLLLGIAVVFLIRSMTRHLKKLPQTFDEQRAEAAAPRRSRRDSVPAGGEPDGERSSENDQAS